MNYIYDIILNFKDVAYDFFEWNKTDTLTHIRKIPIIRINSKDLYLIDHYNVIFDISFLDKIRNKTEIFSGKNIKNIDYACILSDGVNILSIKVTGNNIYYSKLILDEETEVLDVVSRIKESDIEFKCMNKKNIDLFKTRNELDIETYVKRKLNVLEKNREIDKLKYLYYECSGIKNGDFKNLYDSKYSNKLYNILKLLEINK